MEKKYIGEHLKGREWIKDLFDWIADGADTEYWLKRKYQTDNTLLVKDLEQLLDKAGEEGRKEVLSKIKEIFETNIPRGFYSPSETSYLYERFGGAIQQYYIDELSKLKQ